MEFTDAGLVLGILPAFINPTTIALALKGGQLAANLGSKFLGRNDLRDAQKRQDKEISSTNLINAFGGNARPSQQSIQPSGFTNFLSGLGEALGTGADVAGLVSGFKANQANLAGKQTANEAARLSLDVDKGKLFSSAADLSAPRISAPLPSIGGAGKIGAISSAAADQFAAPASQFTAGAPKLAGILGTPAAASQISNFSDPSSVLASIGDLSNTGRLAAQAGVNNRQAGLAAGRSADALAAQTRQQALQQQQFDNRIAVEKLGQGDRKLDQAQRNIDFESRPVPLNLETDIGLSLLDRPTADWATFSANPDIASQLSVATLADVKTAQLAYLDKQRETQDLLVSAEGQALVQNLLPVIKSDKSFAMVPGVAFGYGSVAKGYLEETGQGDIAIITGSVRMKDPTAAVREGDIKTEEQAITLAEKWELIGSGERVFGDGGRMLPEVRDRFLSLAQELYKNTEQDLAFKIPNFKKIGLNFLPVGGDPKKIDTFLDAYKLRPISSFGAPIRTKAMRDKDDNSRNSGSQRLIGIVGDR